MIFHFKWNWHGNNKTFLLEWPSNTHCVKNPNFPKNFWTKRQLWHIIGIFWVDLAKIGLDNLVTFSYLHFGGENSIICCFDANLKTRFYICFNMDKVINLGIPHVGELIFERIDTPELLSCMEDRKLGKNWLKMSWSKDGKAKW